MLYTCRIYTNTGFNAVNIPDSPAVLNLCSFVDVPALDLLQERFLSLIRIRTTWDTVKDCDYCKVGDFYYSVFDIKMTSQDIAVLALTPDFVTSAGGPSALNILDGITERVHVSDDSFGLYTNNDPYMNPAFTPEIVSYTKVFSEEYHTYVESTLALYTMGNEYDAGATSNAIVASDAGGENSVVIPVPTYTTSTTEYESALGDLTNTEFQTLYRVDDGIEDATIIRKGIAHARALGIEDCISGSYSVPTSFVQETAGAGGAVFTLLGNYSTVGVSSLPFVYGTARNNRVWYGSQTPYTLVSAAGNAMTANAEEIKGSASYPSVYYMADPRRTGKPYFRFTPLNGVSAIGYDFFRNCVPGVQWQNTPLVLREKSGSILDQIDYKTSRETADLGRAINEAQYHRGIAKTGFQAGEDILGTGLGAVASLDLKKAGAGLLSSLYKGFKYEVGETGVTDLELGKEYYEAAWDLQKKQEERMFLVSQSVNIPTIKFPVDPELMSEVTHNGFQVYRLQYTAEDIERIDKILTVFGYAHTKHLETSDFTNRQYFNYVRSSISVTGLPKWWADGISSQLGNGVRIWHVLPDSQYYTNNPIVS